MASKASEKIASNLHALKEKRGFSWKEITDGTGISLKRLENCLIGQSEFKAAEVVNLADFFGKTTDYLYRGTDEQNTTVAADLGLNNDAIEFLKSIASSENDEPLPICWRDGWTEEEKIDATSPDEWLGHASVEAIYPSEIRTIVNYLLSDRKGKSLLSMIYKYVTIDPSSATARTPDRNGLEKVSIPVDELLFASTGNNHVTSISVWAMPYAIKEFISILLEEIKQSMRKEEC